MFVERVRKSPDTVAFWKPTNPGWQKYTWRQVDKQVREYSAGLIALGVIDSDRVAIASNTRYEWMAADFAILLTGAATTTVYPTTGTEDSAHIISDSGSLVIFVEDQEQVEKYKAIKSRIPRVNHLVVFDGPGDGDWVITLEELGKRGARLLETQPNAVNERINRVTGDSLATLIYTSGTTGKPKGVELLHKGFTYQAASIDSLEILRPDDVQLLWLPLAHSFGKVLSVNLGKIAKIQDGKLMNAQEVADKAKSKTQEEGPNQPLEGVVFKLPDPAAATSYASVKKREYELTDMSTLDEDANCGTFAIQVAKAGGVKLPPVSIPAPRFIIPTLRPFSSEFVEA